MHVFELADPDALGLRSHPWSGSRTDAAHQYVDLKRDPALVRTALEDFRPWERYAAVETFYGLLEWLNGPESLLETNDCAFNGPSPNDQPAFPKALQCSGRVMVLFRDLPLNTDPARVQGLTQGLARSLSEADEGFSWGLFGATVVPVRFLALPPDAQLGSQLMLSFFAWGDDEAEVMAHLDRTLGNLAAAFTA